MDPAEAEVPGDGGDGFAAGVADDGDGEAVRRARTSSCWPTSDPPAPSAGSSSARPSTPERVDANYDAGVLSLRIPVAEKAKPRKISVGGAGGPKTIDA